jgi:hypothetical protein
MQKEGDGSMLTLEDVEITAVQEGAEYFGQIRRTGRIRHFQPAGTHLRVFSVLVGPFDSEETAIAGAQTSVHSGDWER